MFFRIGQQCMSLLLLLSFCCSVSAQEYPNTQDEAIPFTPPHKALEMMDVPEGFEVTLFAHEPDVHQPIAMTFDSKGRLWVVENYTYSDRKENFNNELFDRVVIFEDEDNDGKFDTRKIFWDKGNKLTGIELGRGGVWLTAAPEFIFIPDADRDDVPDGPPKVILNGFEDDVIRHNLVNGLRWGPDGWLYSRHGIQAVSHVGKPGATMSQRTPMNCCIWRYHPERDVFEIVCEGGTNSWGFDFDQHGEMFFINTVIGHLFHVVPGARYNRMYGSHFNPYTWQTIDQTADHVHWGSGEKWFDAKKGVVGDAGTGSDATNKAGGGHAHSGMMIYQGDNWPEKFRGQLFTLNFHGRRINQETLVREGNSFVGKHAPDVFQTADPWFRGVELTYGPDGGVYVLDWSDIGECHENDGIHRTSGRIFKISYGTPKKPEFEDLEKLSDEKLIELLGHKNAWYPRMAQRILIERSIATATENIDLEARLGRGTRILSIAYDDELMAPVRLNALRTLFCIANSDEAVLQRLPDSSIESIRVWKVRLLADRAKQSRWSIEQIKTMSRDSSSLVRLYVASSIQRLPPADAFEVAKRLAAVETDMNDRVQPKLIWYQIEPFIVGDFNNAMDLFAASKSQLLRRNIVRRLACDPEKQDEMLERLVKHALAGEMPNVQDLFYGIKMAIEGRKQMTAPSSWATLVAKASDFDDDSAKLIEDISPVFGDGLSMDRLMKLATNKDANASARQQAILSLAQFGDPKTLFPVLKGQVGDRLVSQAVVKSMAVCSEEEVAQLILREFKRLTTEGKRNAIDTLCSRKPWSKRLLNAVENGRVPSSVVTAFHARQIQMFDDAALTEKLTKAWGKVRETDQERLAQIAELRKTMSPEAIAKSDIASGKKLFTQHCATCHAMFGAGGNIGPDLTGADRKNLNYLLENIVDPSATVATTYRASVLAMEDGRLLTGVVMDNNGQTLKLQTQEELLTLEVDSVEDIKQTELSLMPEKLLDKLTAKEKIDLFGFLMSK
ncbi:PVC-type heme-binding CxxCH protein [Mariniblastus fucicola]|uniref:Cytochrome c n=1 Tax=Mariniblastus fucicola TaxID=980251 RepID=A0A5B9PAV9_9BACT|nr:PVC-type heme-binding CxxCH protein [Mariniblastus fucicola]QEG22110.1 Cytochrome c [Mariniblastus fucicola]